MKTINGEFGDQYRVGQLLPHMAVALRESAMAKLGALYGSSPSSRGDSDFRTDEPLKRLTLKQQRLSDAFRANRERIFPRIR